MRMIDLINKKIDKKILTSEEIEFVVDGYTKNTIPDYQMSSLLMAIHLNGMTNEEIVSLTKAMINSGEVFDLSDIDGIKLDKHSTGGVGDKVSLVLGPIVAACGGKVAKISGRGLDYTGGTIDKLESIQGFNCFLDEDQFKENIKKINLAIIGQTESLVPADKKIYALRDVTGTVGSIPLIVASVMSKKIASGANAILLDIKCGAGAFMKNIEEARKLAKLMILIGKSFKRDVKIEISNMEQPLGKMIGNKNEVIEAMESLKGNGEPKFMELIFSSGITMLMQAKIVKDKKEAKELIEKVIKNGSAYNKFLEMSRNQGGNNQIIQESNWWKPKFCLNVLADREGYVFLHNSKEIGIVAMKLGAGRKTKDDILDFDAGIEIIKTTNEYVKKNDIIMKLYSSQPIDKMLVSEIKNKSIKINTELTEIKMILEQLE